jgi:FMN phosphatase YigB (HAD superfamily)
MNIKNIVWDLGGVLLKENKLKIFWSLGILDLILYGIFSILSFSNPFKIRDRLFYFLDIYFNNTNNDSYNDNDYHIPKIMVLWLEGMVSGYEIIDKLNIIIDEYYFTKTKYIRFNIEYRLIKKIVLFIFDPNILPSFIEPVKGAENILNYCKDMGLNMFILSNWDRNSFKNIYYMNQNLCIFKFFDYKNIVISGDIGKIKPSKDIYLKFVNMLNIDPKATLFIDNDLYNINTLKDLGFKYIYFHSLNFKNLYKKLQPFLFNIN